MSLIIVKPYSVVLPQRDRELLIRTKPITISETSSQAYKQKSKLQILGEDLEIAESVAVSAPTNFAVTFSSGIASCTWDAVSGALGYDVYAKLADGTFTKRNASLIETTSFDTSYLTIGTYTFYAVAVGASADSDPSTEVIVSTYYTNFSEYTVGETPSDWEILQGTASNYTVEERVGFEGGVGLRFKTVTSGDNYLRWTSIPVTEDMTVIAKMLSTGKGSSTRVRLAGRLISTGTLETSYCYEITGFASYDSSLLKHVSNSFSSITTLASPNWSADILYVLKLQLEGTNVRGKFWVDGNAEPGSWLTEGTDASIADGIIGVSLRLTSSASFIWIDSIEMIPL